MTNEVQACKPNGICTVPASCLAAVAEQTDQILVPDTPDRLNLLPEIFLRLASDETYKKIVILFILSFFYLHPDELVNGKAASVTEEQSRTRFEIFWGPRRRSNLLPLTQNSNVTTTYFHAPN
jgi:hypothetical protein